VAGGDNLIDIPGDQLATWNIANKVRASGAAAADELDRQATQAAPTEIY
jgi:hypothetical protein